MEYSNTVPYNNESNDNRRKNHQDKGEMTDDNDEDSNESQSLDVNTNSIPSNLRQRQNTSPSSRTYKDKKKDVDKNNLNSVDQNDDTNDTDSQNESKDHYQSDVDKKNEDINQNKNSFTLKPFLQIVFAIIVIALSYHLVSNDSSDSSLNDNDWRSKIDPNNSLSDNQRFIVRASLKPILDKSTRDQESVSTLLILSSDEEKAANLARCILHLVNTKKHKDQITAEIDLKSRHGDKLILDTYLRSLIGPDGTKQAVLLRRIDDNSSDDALDQLRLLFAYCDGENPVFSNRLIIMTATSNSGKEKELHEKFKTQWSEEHDFIDALMSRISGHTLYVETDQKSIC